MQVFGEGNALEIYSWRSRRFDFYRCATCGCVTHYERTCKRPDGSDTAAVNMRNIDDPRIVAEVPIRLLDGASTWKVLDESPQPFLLQSPED